MTTIAFDALPDAAGRDLGRTGWTVIDQQRVKAEEPPFRDGKVLEIWSSSTSRAPRRDALTRNDTH